MRQQRPHPQDIKEANQIAAAAYFTACRRIIGARYDTRRASSLPEADALAAAMGADRTMIYAVTPDGLTVAVTDRNRALLPSLAP